MQQLPSFNSNQQVGMRRQYIAQQQTTPQFIPFPPAMSPIHSTNRLFEQQTPVPATVTDEPQALAPSSKKKTIFRIIAALLAIGLVGAIYLICHTGPVEPAASSSDVNVQQQNFSTPDTSTATGNDIGVYVVGAVKHPGIYTLASGARVYDLVQAAGGALPTANLVAVNLAAKLNDGQEVYIVAVGETPPTYSGGVPGTGNSTGGTGTDTGSGGTSNSPLVNINTASIDELTKQLHISKKSAQAIVDYRTQHGDFSSVDSLAQVLSSSVYNKIKAQCTV